MSTKLLKPKPKLESVASHNRAMPALVAEVLKEKDVPFQVRLPESLAHQVKIYAVQTQLSHRDLVRMALTEWMRKNPINNE